MKCQAVLIFIFISVSQLKVVKCSAQGWWQWKLLDNLHRAGWENPTDPIDLSQVPFFIQLLAQYDDVSFIEPQFTRVLPSVAVQGFGSGNLQDQKQTLAFTLDQLTQCCIKLDPIYMDHKVLVIVVLANMTPQFSSLLDIIF